MQKLEIKTNKKRQVVDITDEIEQLLPEGQGLATIFIQHTTAALSTADLDPGTDLDMLDAFEAIMPKLQYRHPHDPSHVTDHIISTMLGASLQVPYQDGELLLGEWQRVVLFEFAGPRTRKLILALTNSSACQPRAGIGE